MNPSTRRAFLRTAALSSAALPLTTSRTIAAEAAPSAAATRPAAPHRPAPNLPIMVEADGRLRRDFSEERLVLEGGIVQLRDGTILALDTYLTPGRQPEEGIGQFYVSRDD